MSSSAPPPGLKLAYDMMTPAEEAALVALIEDSGLTYPIFDPANRRSSTSYGWKYNLARDNFFACAAMPEGFRAVAARAAAFAGADAGDFAECLLNRYEDGAIIQSHHDKPVWEKVIGISLGEPATMIFRHPDTGEERPVPLPRRSMYVLGDDARYVWEHSLPPMQGTRYSITFRTFSAEGLRRLEMSSAEI